MNKKQILYFGKNLDILPVVVRLINQNEQWNGIGTSSENELKSLFLDINFDLVLLGPCIEEENEREIRSFLVNHNPNIAIVQHYGGGSGLLSAEIWAVLGK
jgi:hypothetical protein